MSKSINKKNILLVASGILVFLLACWRTHLGLHSDEVHSIAVGDMIARGNSFFKECWFYLQMSAVFNAPLIKIYSLMHGNLDGIILFLRIATVIVQMLIAILFYCTFYKEFGKTYAMLASFLLFIYVPDFQSFTYKQEIIWFSVLQIIFLYRYCKNGKIVDLILTGCVIALNVLAYPTACMMVLFAFTTIYLLNKQENRNNTLKHCAVIILTCAVCGIIYMGYVLHQIGIEGFITYFPKVRSSDLPGIRSG